jgi:opacity protein-like surface antigen
MLVGTQSGKIYAVAVRAGVFAGSVTVALGLLGSPAALAQNCGPLLLTGNLGTPITIDARPSVAAGLAAGSAISGAVNAANTAFLTQSTTFVSAPANAKPESEGGGIWTRAVGGELTLNSTSQANANMRATLVDPTTNAPVGVANFPGNTTCNTKFRETFAGFQLGQDVAKLNVAGWNLSLGTTAGFLQTNGNTVSGNVAGLVAFDPNVASLGPLNSTTQAPFVGMYGAATYGNFFVDGLIRADYFQTDLNSPTSNFFNQKVDAHGFTAMASGGYNWRIPDSQWFIEPSAGVVWSRVSVNSLDVASMSGGSLISGTVQVNDIESLIVRVGLRVGTTLDTGTAVYAPFAAVSVWHDFAGKITSNFATCPACTIGYTETASTSTNNIGTFGQYSLGVTGQVKDTGWLGFARVDYREGPEMHGVSGTGGIRYQFTPTAAAGAMPTRAPVPTDYPINWTGWYAGLVGGATEYGRASLTFPGVSTADTRPSGWLGGGTLGYNYQAGKWVFGVEGDIAGTSTNGATSCAPLPGATSQIPSPLFQTTCHNELDWIATATARLGYAWTPRTLFYVKGGGAFADEKASVTCNLGPNKALGFPSGCTNAAGIGFTNDASVSAIRTGWTVGVGTEFALTDRWSVKGEVDWLDFGTKALTLSDGTIFNSTLHIAEGKVGFNYKFWP